MGTCLGLNGILKTLTDFFFWNVPPQPASTSSWPTICGGGGGGGRPPDAFPHLCPCPITGGSQALYWCPAVSGTALCGPQAHADLVRPPPTLGPVPTKQKAAAIVGWGCRLPGGVASPADFWQLLITRGQTIGPLPAHRVCVCEPEWNMYIRRLSWFGPQCWAV